MGEFLTFIEGSLGGAVEQGLIYALLALGLFISFRILNTADLTTEGSFTLGAAISAIMVINGHPLLGLLLGICGGALAGMTTAFLQTRLNIQPILAGILVMTALYSINLRVMGDKPRLAFIKTKTVFTPFENIFGRDFGKLVVIALIVLLMAISLFLFLKTHTGLSLRATGDNEEMVQASSINVKAIKFLGLAFANGLVALSGALLAQYQNSAEIGMGTGMVVVGLASLIVGEACFKGRTSVLRGILSSIFGSIIYRILMALIFYFNVSPSDLKLISALIVVVAVVIPELSKKHLSKKSGGK